MLESNISFINPLCEFSYKLSIASNAKLFLNKDEVKSSLYLFFAGAVERFEIDNAFDKYI